MGSGARNVTFAIPGDINCRTGGYIYDTHILRLLPSLGMNVRHLELPSRFPRPLAADLTAALRQFQTIPADHILLADGLAFGALPESILSRISQPMIALVHHPLGCETGLTEADRSLFFERERTALRYAAHIIATSGATRRLLIEMFGVDGANVSIAEPGTQKAARAVGSGGVTTLLAVGAVIPRKGYDILVEALSAVKDLSWRLNIVGRLDQDRDCARRLLKLITYHDLDKRVEIMGELSEDRLERCYQTADLFVMPSLFEGYGMALAEAMARGLPIISTRGGACDETVPDTAALKVDAGDAAQLHGALRAVIGIVGLREKLAAGSMGAGSRLPGWSETAEKIAKCIAANSLASNARAF